MSETRDFPTAVIASISSGTLLCKFGDMHEAAEYLMGHPQPLGRFLQQIDHDKPRFRFERERGGDPECPFIHPVTGSGTRAVI